MEKQLIDNKKMFDNCFNLIYGGWDLNKNNRGTYLGPQSNGN